MDAQVLKIVGAVAGIGGIALALFFWLFRDIVRKNIFPKLTTDQAYKTIRLLMILATVVALAGIASWAFAGPAVNSAPRTERVMTVQLTRVGFETLAPADVLDGADLPAGAGSSVSDPALDRAADQVAAWLTQRGDLSRHESIAVTITPSADPATPPRVEVTPAVKWTAYTVQAGSGGKLIKEVASSSSAAGNPSGWQRPEGEWSLQVDPAGHRLVTMAGDAAAPVTLQSARTAVGVAFEDRAGTPEPVAGRITLRLASDDRFRLVDLRGLAEARERMKSLSPMDPSTSREQISLRENLGIKYFVTTSVRVK